MQVLYLSGNTFLFQILLTNERERIGLDRLLRLRLSYKFDALKQFG